MLGWPKDFCVVFFFYFLLLSLVSRCCLEFVVVLLPGVLLFRGAMFRWCFEGTSNYLKDTCRYLIVLHGKSLKGS